MKVVSFCLFVFIFFTCIELSLYQKTKTLNFITMEKEYLSVAETAKILGYKKSYVYQLIHKNAIPYYKIGAGNRTVRFKREDLINYLTGNRREAQV